MSQKNKIPRNSYDDKFNIIFVGDENVGKTSIINRYINNAFSDEKKKTIGIDNYSKMVTIKQKKILLKVWDTVGQEKIALMTKSHYKIAHEIIIVCAIDNKDSFNSLNGWIENIKDNLPNETIPIFLMANKCDIEDTREVPREKLKELSQAYNIDFVECSAKENVNIEETFTKMINDIYQSNYNKNGFGLEEGSSSSGVNKVCC